MTPIKCTDFFVLVSADVCAGMSVYLGQQEECSAFTIQDPKETFRTIKELGEVLDELQSHHDLKGALTDEPGTM